MHLLKNFSISKFTLCVKVAAFNPDFPLEVVMIAQDFDFVIRFSD
jgi:hypothetical protein